MLVTRYEIIGVAAAIIAILMLGSRNLRFQLSMLVWQILLIAGATALFAFEYQQYHFLIVAVILFLQRAVVVPVFLDYIVKAVGVSNDPGMIIPAPLTMHLSILLLGLSFWVSTHLPVPTPTGIANGIVIATAAAPMSLLFSGLLMMLTRRLALSQIVGFITIENGVYLFALAQTDGLPYLIEMAVFVDILGTIMIAGVLIFSIKRSFEHIDVTRLRNLKH
jgi:hydrogenase-4 component E